MYHDIEAPVKVPFKFDDRCERCVPSTEGTDNHPSDKGHWEDCPSCYFPYTFEAEVQHLDHSKPGWDALTAFSHPDWS